MNQFLVACFVKFLRFLFLVFVVASEFELQHARHWPQFRKIDSVNWAATQSTLDCLTGTGSWQLNSSKVIIDNIYLHAPCPTIYATNNACNWTLDGNNLKYYWQAEPKCGVNLRSFDAPTMCALMENRGNMMVVGDSVSQHSVASWENKLLSNLEGKCPPDRGDKVRKIPGCGNFNLITVRNDYVNMIEKDFAEGKHKEETWIHTLAQYNVSLLVLNRGAHYKPDNIMLEEVNNTLHYIHTHHPHISIIWRNTPHGDANFKQHIFSPPLTSPPQLDGRYYYREFKPQSALVKALLDEHYPRVLYLDVFTSTVLRQDGHYDELHLCVPGIMDTWLQFIYNALLLMAEKHAQYVQEHA